MAIRRAGTIERAEVRSALERIPVYDGSVKMYRYPFTKSRHDALNMKDIIIARYDDYGRIVHDNGDVEEK